MASPAPAPPNPNQDYQGGAGGGWSMSVFDLPNVQDSLAHTGIVPGALSTPAAQASLTGDARAAAIANARAINASALAGLPTYNPGQPSNLDTTPAQGFTPVDPNAPGLSRALTSYDNRSKLEGLIANAQTRVGNTGPINDMANWLFGAGGTPDEYAAKKAANATLGSNAMHEYLAAYPTLAHEMEQNPLGFAQRVGPMLEAAQMHGADGNPSVPHYHIGPDGVPVTKINTNPALTTAFANAHGATEAQGHAGLETQQYSLPEFLHATEGLPRGALSRMWEMQHYLDPRSQAMATGLARAQQAMLDEQASNRQTGSTNNPAAQAYDKLLRQIITGIPQQ